MAHVSQLLTVTERVIRDVFKMTQLYHQEEQVIPPTICFKMRSLVLFVTLVELSTIV